MEGILSAADQQIMVSTFLEIAVGQSADTARQFLQFVKELLQYLQYGLQSYPIQLVKSFLATGWKLEEAIQLFYVGNEGGLATTSVALGKDLVPKDVRQDDGDDVRAPLPVKRDVLYDNPMLYGGVARMGDSSYATHSVVPFRNFEEEMKYPGVWEAEKGSSSSVVDKTQDNLASLYRPPFALMFHGPFEKAKDNARMQNKWLLVNMQSTKEFSSHMLNRDTWANEAVAQTIKTNFIFWQVYDDTEEGRKVCTYYKLDSIPVILVIDPITGQKMHSWRGMVQPETLLEDLLPFMDSSPSDHVSQSHKRPRESSQAPIPHLQSENNDEDEEATYPGCGSLFLSLFKDLMEKKIKTRPEHEQLIQRGYGFVVGCSGITVGMEQGLDPRRSGREVQSEYEGEVEDEKLLWSFCCSELKEDGTRPFRLTQAIPGATKSLDFNVNSTFEESGLANSMVSVYWE
ncbi:hypothetical protein DH2020_043793 [Rehmannia glutinosa]|uniref:UBX domain-containing protein n=1 Tax=Rehmannia glutinosa TaxID=99300 RepID=A0ABR0UKB7_REHGL